MLRIYTVNYELLLLDLASMFREHKIFPIHLNVGRCIQNSSVVYYRKGILLGTCKLL